MRTCLGKDWKIVVDGINVTMRVCLKRLVIKGLMRCIFLMNGWNTQFYPMIKKIVLAISLKNINAKWLIKIAHRLIFRPALHHLDLKMDSLIKKKSLRKKINHIMYLFCWLCTLKLALHHGIKKMFLLVWKLLNKRKHLLTVSSKWEFNFGGKLLYSPQ